MPLTLTKEVLAAAYDYLNVTPPFCHWNLPDSEDVMFRVGRAKNTRGWYRKVGDRHEITMSRSCIGQSDSLIRTMAHEMIHLHEEHAGACGAGMHSAAFNRWAEQVCKVHGFDVRLF